MTLPSPDAPDFFPDLQTFGQQLINDVAVSYNAAHDYGVQYVAPFRELFVSWLDAGTTTPWVLTATFYLDAAKTIVSGFYQWTVFNSTVVDVVPILGNFVDFTLTPTVGSGNSNTTLRVNALVSSSSVLDRRSDNILIQSVTAGVANNGSAILQAQVVVPGPAMLSFDSSVGRWFGHLQMMDLNGAWQQLVTIDTNNFGSSVLVALPAAPLRTVVTNASGSSATLTAFLIHSPR